MRYFKMLCIAVGVCTAMTAFAGTASATTLTSGSGTIVKTGTKIESSLKTKTSAVFADTTGIVQNTCTGSTMDGTTTNETGTTQTANIDALSFVLCTRGTAVLKGGTLHVAWISGTHNGTLSGTGMEVTVVTPTGACVYGTGTGTHIGTLDGASTPSGSATLTINSVLPLIKTESGTCTSTAKWTEESTVTSPLGLMVSS